MFKKLLEFVYHHHIQDRILTTKLLMDKWNLLHLKTLRLHGLDPYCRSAMDPKTVCKGIGPQNPIALWIVICDS